MADLSSIPRESFDVDPPAANVSPIKLRTSWKYSQVVGGLLLAVVCGLGAATLSAMKKETGTGNPEDPNETDPFSDFEYGYCDSEKGCSGVKHRWPLRKVDTEGPWEHRVVVPYFFNLGGKQWVHDTGATKSEVWGAYRTHSENLQQLLDIGKIDHAEYNRLRSALCNTPATAEGKIQCQDALELTAEDIRRTKQEFQDAAKRYRDTTCIDLVEYADDAAAAEVTRRSWSPKWIPREGRTVDGKFADTLGGYQDKLDSSCQSGKKKLYGGIPRFLEVYVVDPLTCFMVEATVAGGGIKRAINTGGCFGMVSLMHEIGHAVGMAHEQSRPDAFHEVTEVGGERHGPILETPAGGVPAISADRDEAKGDPLDPSEDPFDPSEEHEAYNMMAHQSDTNLDAYMGSNMLGYQAYDADSIMQYGGFGIKEGAEGVFTSTTFGATKNLGVGDLSEGDIKQLNDMYQCVRKPGMTPNAPPMSAYASWKDTPNMPAEAPMVDLHEITEITDEEEEPTYVNTAGGTTDGRRLQSAPYPGGATADNEQCETLAGRMKTLDPVTNPIELFAMTSPEGAFDPTSENFVANDHGIAGLEHSAEAQAEAERTLGIGVSLDETEKGKGRRRRRRRGGGGGGGGGRRRRSTPPPPPPTTPTNTSPTPPPPTTPTNTSPPKGLCAAPKVATEKICNEQKAAAERCFGSVCCKDNVGAHIGWVCKDPPPPVTTCEWTSHPGMASPGYAVEGVPMFGGVHEVTQEFSLEEAKTKCVELDAKLQWRRGPGPSRGCTMITCDASEPAKCTVRSGELEPREDYLGCHCKTSRTGAMDQFRANFKDQASCNAENWCTWRDDPDTVTYVPNDFCWVYRSKIGEGGKITVGDHPPQCIKVCDASNPSCAETASYAEFADTVIAGLTATPYPVWIRKDQVEDIFVDKDVAEKCSQVQEEDLGNGDACAAVGNGPDGEPLCTYWGGIGADFPNICTLDSDDCVAKLESDPAFAAEMARNGKETCWNPSGEVRRSHGSNPRAGYHVVCLPAPFKHSTLDTWGDCTATPIEDQHPTGGNWWEQSPSAAQLRKSFQSYDFNGDGEIPFDELMNAVKRLPGCKADEASVRAMMAAADMDSSGMLSESEFMKKYSAVPPAPPGVVVWRGQEPGVGGDWLTEDHPLECVARWNSGEQGSKTDYQYMCRDGMQALELHSCHAHSTKSVKFFRFCAC
jgi:hypothetical protein